MDRNYILEINKNYVKTILALADDDDDMFKVNDIVRYYNDGANYKIISFTTYDEDEMITGVYLQSVLDKDVYIKTDTDNIYFVSSVNTQAIKDVFINRSPTELIFRDHVISFHDELLNAVEALSKKKPTDWHPGSHDIVNNLVHPALYALKLSEPPLQGKDFWGRPYDNSLHQWLPSDISVDDNYRVKFLSYINNLPEGEDTLVSLLERLLSHLMPHFETIWDYAVQLTTGKKKYSSIVFKNKILQVVPKIVEFVLKPGDSYEGAWHYEGMSHENIVATAIYYLRRDKDLNGGELEFKRCFSESEAETLVYGMDQIRPYYTEALTKDFVPLGTLETCEKRLLVFPNSHAHMVKRLWNNTDKVLKRQIVVFFLINPDVRITSTVYIPPQQGVIPHDEALQRRVELMSERKYYKQTLNPRIVELCEH